MIDEKEYDEWELGRLERQLEEYKTLLSAKQKANKLMKKLRKNNSKVDMKINNFIEEKKDG